MPSYDLSRARFRLSDEHLLVLVQMATGEPVPEALFAEREELRECGLIDGKGLLAHVLVPLLDTLIDPAVVISLEAAGRQGELHHGMLIGQEHVISHRAWPGEREAEYSCVEPKMLVWALSDMVNLKQSGSTPQPGRVIETRVWTVEAGVRALEGVSLAEVEGSERAYIGKALAMDGTLGGAEAALLADLIAELRSSWRMTAAWRGRQAGQDGVEGRGFAVWDCGPLGYWHRESPAEPVAADQVSPDTTMRLVQVGPKRVWDLIAELLPEEGELRRG
ncbi:histidine kinase [Streptomyces sp. NPDC059564]|uniref:histidine kinase n=1 Tax=Streptomyces sp. NPDC059564 TaxID=3346865 RepID=UPI00369F38D3